MCVSWHATEHSWRSGDHLCESILFFHCVGPGYHLIKFSGKRLYLLSHLVGPGFGYLHCSGAFRLPLLPRLSFLRLLSDPALTTEHSGFHWAASHQH